MIQKKGGVDHLLKRFQIQFKEFWHSIVLSMSVSYLITFIIKKKKNAKYIIKYYNRNM